MDDVVVAQTHPAAQAQSGVSMVERLIAINPDRYGLLVAATWLWTRFDDARNAVLVGELAARDMAPEDTSNLKMVEHALRHACLEAPDMVRHWCLGEGQPVSHPGPPPQADQVA